MLTKHVQAATTCLVRHYTARKVCFVRLEEKSLGGGGGVGNVRGCYDEILSPRRPNFVIGNHKTPSSNDSVPRKTLRCEKKCVLCVWGGMRGGAMTKFVTEATKSRHRGSQNTFKQRQRAS